MLIFLNDIFVFFSVLFGYATTVIPRVYTYYVSTALFAIFGVRMLREGLKMSPDEGQEELEEVQAEIKKKDEEVSHKIAVSYSWWKNCGCEATEQHCPNWGAQLCLWLIIWHRKCVVEGTEVAPGGSFSRWFQFCGKAWQASLLRREGTFCLAWAFWRVFDALLAQRIPTVYSWLCFYFFLWSDTLSVSSTRWAIIRG